MSDTKLTPYYVSVAVLIVMGIGLILGSLYVENHKIFLGTGILLVLSGLGVGIAAYMKREHYWAPPIEGRMFLGLVDPGQMAACNAAQLAAQNEGCHTCAEAAQTCQRHPECENCRDSLANCKCDNEYVKNNMSNCIIGQTPQYL